MNERNWGELLERSADKVPPSSPPVADILAGAARVRRRRSTAGIAAAVVLVAAAGTAGWALTGCFDGAGDRMDRLAANGPGANAAVDVPPEGMRWAGIGSVAVAVPQDWGHNDTRCGTPTQDTVVVESDELRLCLYPRPEGVDSVVVIEAGTYPWMKDRRPAQVMVDGLEALRWEPQCSEEGPVPVQVCRGAVQIPGSDVTVIAESSTSSAAVDEVLDRVHVLDAGVGVPDYGRWRADMQGRSGEEFARHLRTYGFDVEVVGEQRQGFPAGFLLNVSPRPSTVTDKGAKVTLTVAE